MKKVGRLARDIEQKVWGGGVKTCNHEAKKRGQRKNKMFHERSGSVGWDDGRMRVMERTALQGRAKPEAEKGEHFTGTHTSIIF